MENEPGVLARVIGLFSGRGYNIESLTVAPTEDPTLSRLTLTTIGDDSKIEQIIKHLCDRDIGILITDHNVRETLGICDHAYILNEGEVISAGPPEAILADEQVRSVYLGSEFRM